MLLRSIVFNPIFNSLNQKCRLVFIMSFLHNCIKIINFSFQISFIAFIFFLPNYIHGFAYPRLWGGAVAQSVELATPSEEVPGLIPAAAAGSLLVGSVSV